MFTESLTQTRIDHLSSLPPEILSDIFNLAHEREQPLREPLSKTLLPYFRQNLYREIRLSSTSSLSKLLTTIENNPILAGLVRHLDTYGVEIPTSGPNRPNLLKRILQRLPSLRSLRTADLPSLSYSIDTPVPPSLTTLRSISYSIGILSDIDIDILSQLPNLKRILIGFAKFSQEEEANRTTLDGLEVLELSALWVTGDVDEPCPWTESVANFIDRFPRLTKLVLGGERDPRYRVVLSKLKQVNQSLKSLELWSPQQGDPSNFACDYLLPRFPNLEHLTLGDGTVSPRLPDHLARHSHLQSLTLDYETHYGGPSARQLLSLVQGPTRLVSLRDLVLDSFSGMVGKRFDVEDFVETHSLELSDWRVPDFGSFHGWDAADLQRLKEAGEANGVNVSGSTLEALQVLEPASLEKANRLILRAYQTKSLRGIRRALASHQVDPGRLLFDHNHLDPTALKLVKIDLPEEDWYQFTLE